MDEVKSNDKPTCLENVEKDNSESAENFQKFIYELFDKNGILGDLRAYLRKHIITLLKNAQTGIPPSCQKNFTQRLQLTFQALNMLVAEYLLRMEFNYSLSVFVSELPLANMVFGFSKALLEYNDGQDLTVLRFQHEDLCAVLNYLGVKCDGEHMSNIMNMYESKEQPPLLLCILSCVPMVTQHDHVHSSEENMSTSVLSSDSETDKIQTPKHKCKHYTMCKICQRRVQRLKQKYEKTKKYFTKMFEQVRSAYEAEVSAMMEQEEITVRRSKEEHAILLQERERELEESYRNREVELVRNVREKKKFIWGLARALREQHDSMARAMDDVSRESERLAEMEQSLKQQISEAEQVLKQRGEDVRKQISDELVVLESHLSDMRKERDSIIKERQQLENLKSVTGQGSRLTKDNDSVTEDDLKSHCSLLKDEMNLLRKYIESVKVEPRCVAERSTVTEVELVNSKSVTLMNNETSPSRPDDAATAPPHQLHNEFRKHKNVNFTQPNLEELGRECGRERARTSASSDVTDLQRLQEENERLRRFADQQRSHIDTLSLQQARLAAQLAAVTHTPTQATTPVPRRPRTAPGYLTVQGVRPGTSTNAFGWRKGAGEEWSVFDDGRSTVILPGDRVPFIGPVDARTDCRRHLINQWRLLRRREPPAGPGMRRDHTRHDNRKKSSPRSPRRRHATPHDATTCRTEIADAADTTNYESNAEVSSPRNQPSPAPQREKSPKSVLKEAKRKLRNNFPPKEASSSRDKSPGAVLREAKLRLRKLEIEAEAVEASYRDFRRRQECKNQDSPLEQEMNESKRLQSSQSVTVDTQEALNRDLDKYLNDSDIVLNAIKYNIAETHFKNRNTAVGLTKPIPEAFSEDNKKGSLLDTPLTEFRKLYNPHLSSTIPITDKKKKRPKTPQNSEVPASTARYIVNRETELQILKENINKLYNLKEKQPISETSSQQVIQNTQQVKEYNKKNLVVEVEKVSKASDVKLNKENLVVVVESDINTQELDLVTSHVDSGEITFSVSPNDKPVPSPHMTILVSPKQGIDSDERDEDSPKCDTDNSKSSHEDKSITFKRQTQLSANPSPEKNSLDVQKDVYFNLLEDEKSLEEYPDDFSADVDNNSNSDKNSPISQAQVSEDDNFWDS